MRLTPQGKSAAVMTVRCPHRLAVRTAGFHPANRGSIPLGDIAGSSRNQFFFAVQTTPKTMLVGSFFKRRLTFKKVAA